MEIMYTKISLSHRSRGFTGWADARVIDGSQAKIDLERPFSR